MTATTAGSVDVVLINMAKDWGQLYGKTCFVSGDVLIGGAPLAIQGERDVFQIRPEWYASMQTPTDLRGFLIKADEPATLSQIVYDTIWKPNR